MKKYKTILFDLDGTVSNTKEGVTKCVQYALGKMGIQVDDLEDLHHFVGPPMVTEYMRSYGMDKETALETLGYYRERYNPIGIYECHIYDGIKDILVWLNENGYNVGLATSKPEPMALTVLDYLNIREYFNPEITCGADLNGPVLTKEDVLNKVFDNSNVSKEETVLIGDTIYDVEGCKKVNLDCIGVTYGMGEKEDLVKNGVITTIDHPMDLAKLLQQ